ncbi:hypothetical protein BD779DRAFT_1678116 [Infundibulicybe gibba]|nr:hypothetical protein BD779DRAFT_1678116 [Infundibulicybe gibba]
MFIQDITLRTMLVGLLQVDSDVIDFAPEDVAVVSKLITNLWARSKTSALIPPHLLKTLNMHLRRLIPDEEQYPNPLDFVIPVWETLWRVVATAVYHLMEDPHARLVFARLHDTPTYEQFQLDSPAPYADPNAKSNATGPSAQDFIAEVMRLYPPASASCARSPTHTPSATSSPRG